jgi:hypothetical protein
MKYALCPAIAAIALILAAATAPAQEAPAAPRTISVDELSPGMRGYGLTVVKGSQIDRFDVEIIDVLRGVAPGRNAVVVRCSGLGLEQSGIVAGMSGSPVYIDGRLVGAIAFGWPWPKEPICGVTPIAEMDKALQAPLALAAPSPSWESFDLAAILNLRNPLASAMSPLSQKPAPSAGLEPIAVPLAVPMLSPQARGILESLFPSGRFILAEGAASGAAPADASSTPSFQPGGSLFAALVTGDMTMGAVGTVTDVRGDEIYGLGHPFINQDAIAMPMYTARIHVIFPSTFRSFKIGSPVALAGAITRDRATGIMGTVGGKPRTIPMTVTVESAGVTTKFKYSVFDHYSMTGDLAAAVAAETLSTLGSVPVESTLSYDLAVAYASGRNVDFKWQAAGQGALAAMAKDISALLSTTMFNPIEKLDPSGIGVVVRVDPRDASALIESATVRENEVRPGGALHVLVALRPALAPVETVSIDLAVPAASLPGDKALVVCDGRTSDSLDLQEARHLLTPATIDELLRVLTPRRSAAEVVARLADADEGVALGSDEFPNLPSSTLAILAAPESAAISALYRSVSASARTPYVVTGKVVIPVRITNRPERQ